MLDTGGFGDLTIEGVAREADLAKTVVYDTFGGREELLKAGSEANAKKLGVMRTEGKSYKVKDGEVLHVLFNV